MYHTGVYTVYGAAKVKFRGTIGKPGHDGHEGQAIELRGGTPFVLYAKTVSLLYTLAMPLAAVHHVLPREQIVPRGDGS